MRHLVKKRKKAGVLLVAAVMAVVAALTSCDAAEEDPRTCGGDRWCRGEEGAYDPGGALLYCHVLIARQRILDGEMSVDDLPWWADATERQDGAPVIIDLTTVDSQELARRTDDTRIWMEDLGFERIYDMGYGCAVNLDQEVMEQAEGPRRAPA